MTISTFPEVMLPILKLAADGQSQSVKNTRERILIVLKTKLGCWNNKLSNSPIFYFISVFVVCSGDLY